MEQRLHATKLLAAPLEAVHGLGTLALDGPVEVHEEQRRLGRRQRVVAAGPAHAQARQVRRQLRRVAPGRRHGAPVAAFAFE